MGKARINGKKVLKLGVPQGRPLQLALDALPEAIEQLGSNQAKNLLQQVCAEPELHGYDPFFAELAAFLSARAGGPSDFVPREELAPWQMWGQGIEDNAIAQMVNAVSLPVAARGALMPDAAPGYGLPIGGVLATENAVIPYAVGVDIACRMKLTVFDLGPELIERKHDDLRRVLTANTLFGRGGRFERFERPNDHEVLDDDWSITPFVRRTRKAAVAQLGSSGSGNHFVEFGTLTVEQPELGLEPGTYLALLSHSGSRGPGHQIATHYSQLAIDHHPELPATLRHLAWLDLDSEEGQEYWQAMELMGRFAAANHQVIHDRIAKALKADALATVENHHNFAWKEQHDGKELVVHRKGSTPAGEGVLGIIPGSMAAPGFVVRGKGNEAALTSASHGAGRAMSRAQAKESYRWAHVRPQLEEAGVTLIGGGIDEVPGAYKDIHAVIAAQTDLVDVIARFDPRIVRMADENEEPED